MLPHREHKTILRLSSKPPTHRARRLVLISCVRASHVHAACGRQFLSGALRRAPGLLFNPNTFYYEHTDARGAVYAHGAGGPQSPHAYRGRGLRSGIRGFRLRSGTHDGCVLYTTGATDHRAGTHGSRRSAAALLGT